MTPYGRRLTLAACMLSVGAIRFEDRFCARKKGGMGGGGRVSAQSALHMAAALNWLAVEKP